MINNKTEVDIFCDNIRNHVDLSSFKKLDFEKHEKEEKMRIEEAMYQMMWTFKKGPLEIMDHIPRFLSMSID